MLPAPTVDVKVTNTLVTVVSPIVDNTPARYCPRKFNYLPVGFNLG